MTLYTYRCCVTDKLCQTNITNIWHQICTKSDDSERNWNDLLQWTSVILPFIYWSSVVSCCFILICLSVCMCLCVLLTVAPASSMALTNATASEVQERTVSVRPSLNIRVIDDSYVRQNTPWSCEAERLMSFCDGRWCSEIFKRQQWVIKPVMCFHTQGRGWLKPYPELCQLQGHLNKGIRAGPALLDQAFSKVSEQIAMEVHIISYVFGWQVWSLDYFLALREGKTEKYFDFCDGNTAN